MNTLSSQEASSETGRNALADYSGLRVQVIFRMEHYSLVRYRNRRFVVNTQDLRCQQSMKCAA
jgi:hypothetical protein